MIKRRFPEIMHLTVRTRWKPSFFILLSVIILNGCAVSLGRTSAGIFDVKTSKAVSVSDKRGVIVAVDNTRRELMTFSRANPYSNDVVMTINDFNGKEIESRHIFFEEGFVDRRDYAVSPDCGRLALYSLMKKTFSIFEISTNKHTVVLDPNHNKIYPGGIKWISNSEIIIIGNLKAYDADIIKFNVDNKTITKIFKFEKRAHDYFVWPDSKFIGLVLSDDDSNREIRIFDPVKMEFIETFRPSNPQISIIRMCLSPSARRLAYWEVIHSYGGMSQNFITVVDLDTKKETRFRQKNISEMVFLDEDTLAYTYFSKYSLLPPEVRKLDIKNNLDIVIIKSDEPFEWLFSADGGKKLLFSAY